MLRLRRAFLIISIVLTYACVVAFPATANAVQECTYDSAARALAVGNGQVVDGIELLDWCVWEGGPYVGGESLVDRVDARPSTGRASVTVRSWRARQFPVTWYLHTPTVDAVDLRLVLHLDENSGRRWSVLISDGSIDIDGDGTAEIVIDRIDQWSIDIFGDNANASIDLRAANLTTRNNSTIGLRSTKTIPGSNIWGARNGADLSIGGSTGADRIVTFAGDDTISGGPGNDNIISGAGNDAIGGGPGNDIINAGAGQDRIDADAAATGGSTRGQSPGNDIIYTGSGTNYVSLSDGRDSVIGGSGTELVDLRYYVVGSLRLGAGRDVVEVGRNAPRLLNCGVGRDVIQIGPRDSRPAGTTGCEAVGSFQLLVETAFPWGTWNSAIGIQRGWRCANRYICPFRRY